jgi:dynein heavy chain
LGDCFDGLKTLNFLKPANPNETPKVADAMFSKDDEKIPFSKNFICEGAVEAWLDRLEFKMRETLQENVEMAKNTSELWDTGGDKPREIWVEDYCA